MKNKNLKRTLTSLCLTLALSTYSFAPALAATAVKTTAPLATAVSVTNNKAGTDDTITVAGSGLLAGDTVSIYSVATGGSATTSASITTTGQAITFTGKDYASSATAVTTGKIYVSIKSIGKDESTRTAVTVPSDAHAQPALSDITVTNNAKGSDDTILVSGLTAGDTVTAYDAATLGNTIASGTTTGTSITLSKVDGLKSTTGSVYVTVASATKSESKRTAKPYLAESKSTAPVKANVKITNNKTGAADTVDVSGLAVGDLVTVYSAATAGSTIISGTTTGTSITLSKVDAFSTLRGTAYVTVTSTNKDESIRTAVPYLSDVSIAPKTTEVVTANNPTGATDTVLVKNVANGDIVNIYSDATTTSAIMTATSTGSTITLSKTDLMATKAGKIYVTVTRGSQAESLRTVIAYKGEPITKALKATNIVILNNDTGSDILRVTGLDAGYIINVYDARLEGTKLGTATVADGKKAVNVSLTLPATIGTTGKGKVYVTVTSTVASESARTEATYIAEE